MALSGEQKRTIIERRMQVSAFRLGGVRRQDTIADELGTSRATICRDWKWLDALYQERAAEDIAQAKGNDLERIDDLIFALWARAKSGELEAIREVRALLDSRAKLLGLNAPVRQEHRGASGGPIQQQVVTLDLSDEVIAEALRTLVDVGAAGV